MTHRIKKWQEQSRRHEKAKHQGRMEGYLLHVDHQEEHPQQGDHRQLDPYRQDHRQLVRLQQNCCLQEVLAVGVAQRDQPQVRHEVHQRKRAKNCLPKVSRQQKSLTSSLWTMRKRKR